MAQNSRDDFARAYARGLAEECEEHAGRHRYPGPPRNDAALARYCACVGAEAARRLEPADVVGFARTGNMPGRMRAALDESYQSCAPRAR